MKLQNRSNIATAILFLIPVAMLVAAVLLKLPYGYYSLLRIVVSGFCAFYAFQAYKRNGEIDSFGAVSAIFAFLFNPIFPVHLTKEIWQIVDLTTALWLSYLFLRMKRQNETLV